MSTHKHFDKICCVVIVLTLILTALFMNAEALGVHKESNMMGYESKLFDTSKVHTLNIIMDDWDEFLDNAKSEEYYDCDIELDGEKVKNVAIRGKGNTSLSMVNNDRYSFKIEFDHYDDALTYYGLDKLCLNNIIQDNTYMKDYISYQLMNEMGVASPLCSYVYITVNGEDWGLYLAVEAVEDSFLQRNYGNEGGELYKPDSMSFGGGRGNGKDFDMDNFMENFEGMEGFEGFSGQMPNIENMGGFNPFGEGTQMPNMGNMTNMEGFDPSQFGNGQMPDRNRFNPVQDGEELFDETVEPANTGRGFDGEMPSSDMSNSGNSFGGQRPNRGTTEEFNPNNQEINKGQMPNFGGGFGMGSSDVKLQYTDDNFDSYSNIFNNAKTDITKADKERLIEALRKLTNGEDIEDTVAIEEVIRYFVVHNFVVNGDSYTGSMIHNYYLYENDGQMQMIPWDYNLAFGTFQGGGDATSTVNSPIDSPVSGDISDRPMIAWIFNNEEYTELYHTIFAEFIDEYFESGYFENVVDTVKEMITPYVEKDPTKFCTYEEFEKGISTLKEFCILRAESIDKQLDGSIGKTDDTQDNSTFVNADDLQISDMGSMGKSMGGNRNPIGGDMQQMPNDRNNTNEGIQSFPNGKPEMNMGQNNGNRSPQKFDGNIPNFNDNQQRNEMNGRFSNTDWTLLVVCVGILAVGLVITTVFTRRKK